MGELYIHYEYWIAALQLIFAMLGMGATLTVYDFTNELKVPKGVVTGTLIQLIAVPLIALLLIKAVGLTGGVAIGVALIAAIPGGTTSNIFTYMARGNSALSIAITALTTFACLATTPLILAMLITEYLPANFTMPTQQIVNEIALTLLLPLIVGMLILRYLPTHARWISKWSIRASLFGILMIVVGSISAGRLNLSAFGVQNIVYISVFIMALTAMAWGVTKLLGLNLQDSTAIEIEVVVRNVNLAVLIKASLFPATASLLNSESANLGDTVLFAILLYGVLQMLIAAVMITKRRSSLPV